MENNSNAPRWEIRDQSPTLENDIQESSKFKIKLKHGGYFRLAKNSSRRRYCFGFQKCLHIDTYIYTFSDLIEEVTNRYPPNKDLSFSICFIDKCATDQCFIKLDSQDNLQLMLRMYEVEKESTVYVTTDNNVNTSPIQERSGDDVCQDDVGQDDIRRDDVHDKEHGEKESYYSLSDEDYHSLYNTDNEIELQNSQPGSYRKDSRTFKVNSTFKNVIDFRRALAHYAITNQFTYFLDKSEPTRVTARCFNLECKWRVHASVMQDGITFEVKTLVEPHTCTRSSQDSNKNATQGWIASVLKDKIKSNGDVSTTEVKKWLLKNYNVDPPYMRVFRGKEQAYSDMYGKWEDSFIKINDFKEVKGIPCVHATAFIVFTRDVNWDKYVDPYFSIEKYKLAYALEVAPMTSKDEWVHIETEEKIYPPALKRPPGRPRKNRIKPNDEPKRRNKCRRCGGYGHQQKTCKNSED